MKLDREIAALSRALEAHPRVVAAVLFGSAATGSSRPGSDLDVALVARSDDDAIALSHEALDLGARLSLRAGRDVQVVVLDRVEPVLGRQALLHGRVLFDRDPARRADVAERILREYFDGEHHRRVAEAALERRAALRDG